MQMLVSRISIAACLFATTSQAYDCDWASYHDFAGDGWTAKCTSKVSALSVATSYLLSQTVIGGLLSGIGIIQITHDAVNLISHGGRAVAEGSEVKAALLTGTGCKHCWMRGVCATTPNEFMVCVAKRPARDVRVSHPYYNKALNLQGHQNVDGGHPNVWEPGFHNDQIWSVEKRGNGQYWIKNSSYNKCLNLQNHENKEDGRPSVWTCSSHYDQYWTFDENGHIRHSHYGKCLNLQGHENHNGGTLSVFSCGDHSDQQWDLVPPFYW